MPITRGNGRCRDASLALDRRRRRKTPMRVLVGIVACAAGLAAGEASFAASEEDCRAFHEECTDAVALGYRDAGICNVERLECKAEPANDPAARVVKRPRGASGPRQDGRSDPERSIGP